MSRRWLQNLCIIVLFLVSFIAVIAVGLMQGRKNQETVNGISLEDKPAWEEWATETAQEAPQTVYITPSGSKYHLYTDCSSLKRSKKIMGAPYEQARSEGRDLCSLCEKRSKDE